MQGIQTENAPSIEKNQKAKDETKGDKDQDDNPRLEGRYQLDLHLHEFQEKGKDQLVKEGSDQDTGWDSYKAKDQEFLENHADEMAFFKS